MTVPVSQIDANTDTFATWISVTNVLAETVNNFALTANSTEGTTGNTTNSLNARLYGKFAANTVHIVDSITTNGTSYNVSLDSINLELKSTSKLYTVGELNVKNDLTIATAGGVRIVDRTTTYSTTQGWLKANSSGYLQFTNLNITEDDLANGTFALSANMGYATSTRSNNDVIAYSAATGRWVRNTLNHLGTISVDNLFLGANNGLVRANSSVSAIRINANVNIGGASVALFVSNTNNRVGMGQGMTNPAAQLHVNGAIYATGDVTAYFTSDEKLKTDIQVLDQVNKKLEKIKGVTFTWDQDKIKDLDYVSPKQHTRDIGVIAQDVNAVFPEAVIQRPDGYLAVDYTRLVPVLIEAVKELNNKVKKLEERLGSINQGSE